MLNTGHARAAQATVATTIAPRRRELRLLRDPYWPYGQGHDALPARAVAQEASGDPALVDRLRTLRSILPAMATEVSMARQEGARLRTENAKLRQRLRELDADFTVAMAPPPSGRAALVAAGPERG